MDRNSQHLAIILRISPLGEIHSTVDILTPERGVLRVIAYGLRSRRASLRGRVVPFARGTVYLYTDPRREMPKVVDFDVQRYLMAVPQDLTAYYHGNLWAEVVWRTLASGDGGDEAFRLLDEGLDLLEATVGAAKPGGGGGVSVGGVRGGGAPGSGGGVTPGGVPGSGGGVSVGGRAGGDASGEVRPRVQLLSAILLWRYLALLGLQPDLESCTASSRAFAAEETRYYDRREGSLVGAEWADPAMITLPPGVARLLIAADRYPLGRAIKLPVTAATLTATRGFVLAAIQDAVEVPLNTLRVAAGSL